MIGALLASSVTLFAPTGDAPRGSAVQADDAATSRDPGPVLLYRIPEHDFFPESIAFDPVSECYFLGSMSHRRILRLRKDGSVEDFVTAPEAGLLSSIGMKVDARRRVLWVCTGRYNLYADFDSAPARTGVVGFRLDDGGLVDEWLFPQESVYHIFNDLVVAPGGEIYATTTLMGRVYRLEPGKPKAEVVLQLAEGRHDNGVTFGPSHEHLYLAIDRTIHRLKLETRELVELAMPPGEGPGVDGLYYHEGSLVAVLPRSNRIARYFLNDDGSAVERAVDLVRGHEDFAYPTTGVIVGTSLVVVATSYADRPRKADPTAEQHPDVLIYEVPLEVERDR